MSNLALAAAEATHEAAANRAVTPAGTPGLPASPCISLRDAAPGPQDARRAPSAPSGPQQAP